MKTIKDFILENITKEQEDLLNSVKTTVSNAKKDYEVRMADENDIAEKKSKGCVVVVVNGNTNEQSQAKSILSNFKFTTYGTPNKVYYFIKK